MTKLQAVNRLARLWRKRLNLTDWTFEIEFVDEIDLKGSWGSCQWHPDEPVAMIKLLAELKGHELELSLVHEILHVRMEGHIDEPPYNVNVERALNATAEALIAAYRGTKKT